MAAKKSAAKKSEAPQETRDQKFTRLAVKRVNKAINDIRLVSNLASYPHTEAQTESIVNAMSEALGICAGKLAGTKVSRAAFTL